ncbi:TIGR00180 family glycosyltransferase [uncultured Prochlorococcus sp.]|uniref:TIGR00180 family glycosyltransferase n=1 Tax=uncultured Prochlorococcus sp. TaxID=159733 RepID=UPI00258BB912|nr:TIGR00180 family glycosyltransferase [uncultured Prochlorococcus sp.]
MKENEISILIPTLSRQEILLETLNFYYRNRVKFVFNICDSTKKNRRSFLERINYLSKELNINYYHKINFSDREAIFFLMGKTETPFAAFSGDDDFFVPSGLIKCADFLKKNNDFRVAYGKAIIVDGKSLNNKKAKISASNYWGNLSFEDKNVITRLDKLSSNYLVNLFGVHRSKELKYDYKVSSNLPSRTAAEILTNYLTIIRGKGKFLNHPYLIRQVHPARYLMDTTLESTLIDDNLAEAIPDFIDALSKALLNQGIKKKYASLLSKKYIKKILSGYESSSYFNLRKKLKVFDVFYKLFRRIYYTFKNKLFRKSIYYRDFKSTLKSISSKE